MFTSLRHIVLDLYATTREPTPEKLMGAMRLRPRHI